MHPLLRRNALRLSGNHPTLICVNLRKKPNGLGIIKKIESQPSPDLRQSAGKQYETEIGRYYNAWNS